jgi:hypothetical protein
MGFNIGNFFKKVGTGFISGVKTVGNTVGGFVKPAVKFVHDKVLPGVAKVATKVGHGVQKIVTKTADRIDRLTEAPINLIEGAGKGAKGLGDLLSNPMGILAAGAGVIVLASVLK